MRPRARSVALAFVLSLALPACASMRLVATQQRLEAPKLARVELSEIDEGTLTFDVYNLSSLNMVVLRDKIVLETPAGRQGREPGGLKNYYNVPPGGVHDVKVRFDLSACRPGQELKVLFDAAVLVDSTPVPLAPLSVVCRDS